MKWEGGKIQDFIVVESHVRKNRGFTASFFDSLVFPASIYFLNNFIGQKAECSL